MSTINQLVKKPRQVIKKKTRRKDLNRCPQKLAVCRRVFEVTPRKPNSAKRKVARVAIIETKKHITAYIPGIKHSLQKFSTVLVRGGRAKDVPGSKYKLIRGVYDLTGVVNRVTSRSKYGIKLFRGINK